jgi:hypothetical protein
MTHGEANVIIHRAISYVGTDYEFLPTYEELVEASEKMLAVRLGDGQTPGRCTKNGWEMTAEEMWRLRQGVDHAMSNSCPYACTGEVKLWKIAALFNHIDRLEGNR